ncbi:hypothetical protein [Actinoplanes sp. NPDC051494]|uniref:hypothetical protein n=1 Tax=Actinoplanes sp. NPDC051494 TaxID=3363907 RepID=UPI0037ACB958
MNISLRSVVALFSKQVELVPGGSDVGVFRAQHAELVGEEVLGGRGGAGRIPGDSLPPGNVGPGSERVRMLAAQYPKWDSSSRGVVWLAAASRRA